ncbi:uncharacterized protein [Drosophila bipectinata]|uniref:uncharacterized protein n=1 Tax=Drosophila bipectinata TaxID=42026 RepID=UPI001C8A4BA9|nr:uncharacterized protein LOC108127908 [Drosophila bipectinata]
MNQCDIRTFENSRVCFTQHDKNYSCKAPGLSKDIKETVTRPQEEIIPSKNNYKPFQRLKIVECKSSDVEETFPEEEECGKPSSEMRIPLKNIVEEFNRIKRRVSRLNHLLQTDAPECPSVKSCFDDIDSKLYETCPLILDLQISGHKLDIQLCQLLSAHKSTVMSIKMRNNELCSNKEKADALSKQVGQLDFFQKGLEKEQTLCLERYRHIDSIKLNWCEFDRDSEKLARLAAYQMSKLIKKSKYPDIKRYVFKLIKHLYKSSREARVMLIKELNHVRDEFTRLSGSSYGSDEGRDVENESHVASFKT